MYKLEYNKFPKLFSYTLAKITYHHEYGTKEATSSNYFLPSVDKKIAQNQLSFRESKLWSTINLQKNK